MNKYNRISSNETLSIYMYSIVQATAYRGGVVKQESHKCHMLNAAINKTVHMQKNDMNALPSELWKSVISSYFHLARGNAGLITLAQAVRSCTRNNAQERYLVLPSLGELAPSKSMRRNIALLRINQ